MSQQIILLEKELGIQLLHRSKKKVQLTEAGRILHKRAEQVVELLKTAVDEVQESAEGIGGKLSIGSITSSGRSLVPDYTMRFHLMYPKVSFDLRQGDSLRILEFLDTGLIEIGLVRLPIDESRYNFIVLPQERMVAVSIPNVFPIEEKEELKLAQLENTPLLILRRYAPTISEYCRNILCVSDDVTPLLLWVRLGLGVAIVPESSINLLEGSPLLVRAIDTPAFTTTGAVIWLKKHSLSAAALHFTQMFLPK